MPLDWTRMKELLEEFQKIVRQSGRPAVTTVQTTGIKGHLQPDIGVTRHRLREPRNNDGRAACWWCGAPTKRVLGVIDVYDICTECGK